MSPLKEGTAAPAAALGPIPQGPEGPVFAEPWQAQAFALAVKLAEAGHFTWKEWTEALGAEIARAAAAGAPDNGSRYYEHWLAALERMVSERGLASAAALLSRKEAWAAAYATTPHGQPVHLPPGADEDAPGE